MTPEEAEREALAGEYVLGTLDAAQARAVRDDPTMAEAIAGWETRLAPWQALAVPEAPPPDLWTRIETSWAMVRPWHHGFWHHRPWHLRPGHLRPCHLGHRHFGQRHLRPWHRPGPPGSPASGRSAPPRHSPAWRC